ncbi:uncharacterized protein LOC144867197 [Branchiostoma floridae x Branchiostoma japonicum]
MASAESTLNSDQVNNLRESLMDLMVGVNHQLEEIAKLKIELETDETVSTTESDIALLSSWANRGKNGKTEPTTKLAQSSGEESATKADRPLTLSGTDPASGKEQLLRDSHMNDSSETEKSSGLEARPNSSETAPENPTKVKPQGEDAVDPLETLERFADQLETLFERSKIKIETLLKEKEKEKAERRSAIKSHLENNMYRLDRF